MNLPIELIESQAISVGTFGKSVGLDGGIRFFTLTDFPEVLQKGVKFYLQYHKNLHYIPEVFDTQALRDLQFAHKDFHSKNYEELLHTKTSKSHKELENKKSQNNKYMTSDIIRDNKSNSQIEKSSRKNVVSMQKKIYFPVTLFAFNPKTQVIHLDGIIRREHADCLRNLTLYSTIEDTKKLCNLSKDEFFYFDIIGMSVVEDNEIIGTVKDIQKIANTYYFVLEANFLIPYIERYVLDINLESQQIFTNDARYLKLSN